MAKWIDKNSNIIEAFMWTGDNLGFINDNFGTHFYAGDNDILYIDYNGVHKCCRPGDYISKIDDHFITATNKAFNELYKPYKEQPTKQMEVYDNGKVGGE